MRRRAALTVVPVLLALLLAACTGMPTSGPVNPGLPPADGSDSPPIAFLPDRPQPGATPEQIVDGFLRAGSGPSDSWAVARSYLAPGTAWQPTAGVTVDHLPDRALTTVGDTSGDTAAVAAQLTPTALVDATGAYSATDAGPTPISFQLARQGDGQWRITKAPDGIVLDSDTFPRVYRPYSLMYFDPSWQRLVPDIRWYPSVNAPTRIVAALVDGAPSPWLARSVVTAFPDGISARAAVPIVNGVAEVELGSATLTLPAGTLDRMQAQLEQSLSTAGVTGVQMTVGGAPVSATAVQTRSTSVDTRALVRTDAGFGFLTGGEVQPVAGLSAAIEGVDARSIQVSADGAFAAARLGSGAAVRVGVSGDPVLVDGRADLVDPTVDTYGFIWTVPAGAPAGVVATSRDGDRVEVAGAWPSASRIAAMQVSRDGARLAALVQSGGRWALWVAGVIRDDTGRPTALGSVLDLATVPGTGVAAGWIDEGTVGVVSRAGDETSVLEQPVGGIAQTTTLTAEVDTLAGAGPSFVRVRGTDGTMYVRRVANWQVAASGVRVLASEQGLLP